MQVGHNFQRSTSLNQGNLHVQGTQIDTEDGLGRNQARTVGAAEHNKQKQSQTQWRDYGFDHLWYHDCSSCCRWRKYKHCQLRSVCVLVMFVSLYECPWFGVLVEPTEGRLGFALNSKMVFFLNFWLLKKDEKWWLAEIQSGTRPLVSYRHQRTIVSRVVHRRWQCSTCYWSENSHWTAYERMVWAVVVEIRHEKILFSKWPTSAKISHALPNTYPRKKMKRVGRWGNSHQISPRGLDSS